jgi:hypothetical protein
MPLGLESSEQLDDFWSQNSRRKVFYSYPNGTAPLTGFLSLADPDNTSHPQYGWNEERWEQRRTVTITGPTSNVPFYTGGTNTSAGATFTPTAGTTYRLYVQDADQFQVDDVVKVHRLNIASSTTYTEISGLVTGRGENAGVGDYIEVKVLATAPGAVTNNSASLSIGLPVVHAGSAFAEGSRSRTGRYKFPSEIFNYTQIFKTAFEMTGTALKEPTKYDKTGDYKNQLKKNGIDHLAGMEWAFLFGDRRVETAEDPDTGSTVRRGFVGGLLWFLKQWEKGSVANGGAFDYRSNAVDVSAQTDYRAYPDKRIIRLQNGSISKDDFEAIEALPFERTNSTEWCKLCLAGPGYIGKINARYQKEVQVTQLRGEQYDNWDFKLTKRSSLQGDVYYKLHPLFNNPEMRDSAFYIDLGYIKYRPMEDRDTDVMSMIQLPDADKRKDQWLTEAGLELAYPEAHMFVDSLGQISL